MSTSFSTSNMWVLLAFSFLPSQEYGLRNKTAILKVIFEIPSVSCVILSEDLPTLGL